MKIAIISGLMAGKEKNGLIEKGKLFYNHLVKHYNWNDIIPDGFDVLIGFSYGGHTAVRHANNSVITKKLFLLNPVKQDNWITLCLSCLFKFRIPWEVECIRFYSKSLPFTSKISQGEDVLIKNCGHAEICERQEVWDRILKEVEF